MNRFLFYVVLCFVLVSAADAQGTPRKPVKVSPKAARLITLVLDLRNESLENADEQPGSPFWKLGVLLGKILDNKSAAADEAVAVLLGYYLGESNGEDLMENILVRGKRELPYLKRFRGRQPLIQGREMSYSKLPHGDPNDYNVAIKYIRNGRRHL